MAYGSGPVSRNPSSVQGGLKDNLEDGSNDVTSCSENLCTYGIGTGSLMSLETV